MSDDTPAPEVDDTPAPEVDDTPAPEVDDTPAPEVEVTGDGSLKGEIVGDASLARGSMVEALLAERAGYARRGLADRVAQVDEQLAYHSYTEPPVTGEAPAKARGQRTAKG
jgi:hypothetical protein